MWSQTFVSRGGVARLWLAVPDFLSVRCSSRSFLKLKHISDQPPCYFSKSLFHLFYLLAPLPLPHILCCFQFPASFANKLVHPKYFMFVISQVTLMSDDVGSLKKSESEQQESPDENHTSQDRSRDTSRDGSIRHRKPDLLTSAEEDSSSLHQNKWVKLQFTEVKK